MRPTRTIPTQTRGDGYDALMAGKPHVVAGSRKNWFQVTAATHLPDQIISKMQATMTKPGSGGYDGCGSPLL